MFHKILKLSTKLRDFNPTGAYLNYTKTQVMQFTQKFIESFALTLNTTVLLGNFIKTSLFNSSRISFI